MTIFLFKKAGDEIEVVSPNRDEMAARQAAAGEGKARDESLLTHDGGWSCEIVDPDAGPARVIGRRKGGAAEAKS